MAAQQAQTKAVAFMDKVKFFAEGHLKAVNEVLVELHGAEEPGVEAIMGREVERSRQYHAEELDALGSWSGEALESPHRTAPGSPSPRTKRSMQERLAAMGAVPALGGLMQMGPAPVARGGLTPTASPAARELLQRRLDCADGGVIATVGRGGSSAAAGPGGPPPGGVASPRPSWQTELKARRSNVGGTPMRPATETAVNNELAALFAKRQALT